MPTWFWFLALFSYALTASGITQCADIDIVEECPNLDFTYHSKNQNAPTADIRVTDVNWHSGDLYEVTISFESSTTMSKSSLSELKFTGSINRVLYSHNLKIDRIENPGKWSITMPIKLPAYRDRVYMTTDYQIQFDWCSAGVSDYSECEHWNYASSYNYITGCCNYEEYKEYQTDSSDFYWPKHCGNIVNEEQSDYLGSLLSSVKEVAKKAKDFTEDFGENHKEVYDSLKSFYEKDGSITKYAPLLINSFMGNTKLLSTAVELLRSGLLEDYVPSSQSVIEYAISRLEQHSPELSSYLESLKPTSNVSSGKNAGSRKKAPGQKKMNKESVALIVKNLISSQTDIDLDPDHLQLAINILTAIVLQNPVLLLQNSEQFKLIITKTLFLLRTSEDGFVKESLLKFWSNLIDVKKVTAEEVATFSKRFEQEFGSILTSSGFNDLLSSVKSDVESYSNVIGGELYKYQLYLKDWVKESLNSIDEQTVDKVLSPLPEKEFFKKQLSLTKESTRKYNNIIKGYWSKANEFLSDKKTYAKYLK